MICSAATHVLPRALHYCSYLGLKNGCKFRQRQAVLILPTSAILKSNERDLTQHSPGALTCTMTLTYGSRFWACAVGWSRDKANSTAGASFVGARSRLHSRISWRTTLAILPRHHAALLQPTRRARKPQGVDGRASKAADSPTLSNAAKSRALRESAEYGGVCTGLSAFVPGGKRATHDAVCCA